MVRAGEWRSCGRRGWYYALTDALDALEALPVGAASAHPLPFNLVIRRRWLRNVFGFDFALECYLGKRVYGYYCLPLLWGDRFVGRLDAKADRKARVLVARGVLLEPGTPTDDGLLPALARELHAFAAFNRCDDVLVERVEPSSAAGALRAAVDRGAG